MRAGYVRRFGKRDPAIALKIAEYVQQRATDGFNLVCVAVQEIGAQDGIGRKRSAAFEYLRAGRWLMRHQGRKHG